MSDEALDRKLLTVPTVVVQNLLLEPPASPTLSLSEYCRLPAVRLEKLQLEITDTLPEKTVILEPKVCLENLNLSVERGESPAVPDEKENVYNTSPSLTRPPSENMDSVDKVQSKDVNMDTSFSDGQLLLLNKEQLFSKVPVVVVERYDGNKHIKKRVSFSYSEADYEHDSSDHKLSQIKPCSVILTKQNLEELKESLKCEPQSCHVCGKIYFSTKKLAYHIEAKHDLVQPGRASKKRVSFSSQVIVHTVAETHYSPLHRCRKCYKLFITYDFLREHMKLQHRKRDKYICDYCEKLFADRAIFKLHIKLHCHGCLQLFSERKDLVQHKKEFCIGSKPVVPSEVLSPANEEIHSPKIFDCDICKEKFVTRCYLIQHLRTHNRSVPSSDMPYTRIVTYSIADGYVDIFTCQYCFESFESEEKIKDHLKPYMKYKCMHCTEKFNDENQLLKHLLTHEVGLSLSQRPNGPLSNLLVKVPKLSGREQTGDFHQQPPPPQHHNVPQIENSLNVGLPSLNVESSTQNDIDTSTLPNPILPTILTQEKSDTSLSYTNGINVQDDGKQKQKKERSKLEKKHFCMVCHKAFVRPYLLRQHMKNKGHYTVENGDYSSNGDQQPLLTSNMKYGRLLNANYTNQMGAMPLMCANCEETFAWPELLRDHRCIVAARMQQQAPLNNSGAYQAPSIHTLHFDDHSDIPMYNQMPGYLRANHRNVHYGSASRHDSMYNQRVIDIEVPPLEFAPVAAPLPEVYEVSPLETDKRSKTTRYKLVRQEVPIEF